MLKVEFLVAWTDHTWSTLTKEWRGDLDATSCDMVDWFLEAFVDDGDIAGVLVYRKYYEDEEDD